jgi:hypothetical protein
VESETLQLSNPSFSIFCGDCSTAIHKSILDDIPQYSMAGRAGRKAIGNVRGIQARLAFAASLLDNSTFESGRNSVVECQLPKLDVAGSTPVARSNNSLRHSTGYFNVYADRSAGRVPHHL